ncbi:MFS transporter [Undibacterium sp. TS12]|uniref:MFS transporter n=1 Tax=Undibacterium sp. TS12 TaxID=2908202 RepID=UPI001F4CE578|nr:MFS transporter [Undibacterium sp. TS12]MCH8620506.1 MFS transporter [Undibacterium sp. TS12]
MKPESTSNSANFTSYQKIILLLLGLIQFSVILDFVIIAPIGDILMKSLSINVEQFGLVVSSYAFSTALSGIAVAGFIDKFDRKKVLLFFFTGFIIGTVCCALASTYTQMMAARILTGVFAGVTGSVVMTIVSDLFVPQVRGRAMGFVQMGFGAAQVMGVPIGIFIATHLGWHMTFLSIVAVAIVMLAALFFVLKPMQDHMKIQRDKNPFLHLWHTVINKDYQVGFLAVMFLTIGGFMIMPFSSIFLINNVHLTYEQLPFVFMFTGLASMISMPVIGKLSDKFDRYKLFVFGSGLAAIMILIYTNLHVTPLWMVVIINILVFVGIMCRISPAQALNSMVPQKEDRGAYMSISASLQQTAGGLGSVIASMIVFQQTKTSPLQNFDVLGYAIVCIFAMCVFFVYRVSVNVKAQAAQAAQTNLTPQAAR